MITKRTVSSILYDVSFEEFCRKISKGEDVISLFPKRIQEQISIIKEKAAIADIAGRDSVAAILKAFEKNQVKSILPVVDFKVVQYGDKKIYQSTVEFLKKEVKRRFNGTVLDMFSIGDIKFWRLLNARYVQECIEKFHFYSPCIGCHLYFHSMRAVVAKRLGINAVISGERESHNGKKKINQLPFCLNSYHNFLSELGVKHLQPVRFIEDGKEIEKIIGKTWSEGENQLKCIYSGNYRDLDGKVIIEEEKIKEYLTFFAIPLARIYIKEKIAGSTSLDEEIRSFCLTLFKR